MQNREVQQLLDGAPWTDLCAKVTTQLAVVGSPIAEPGDTKPGAREAVSGHN